MPNSNPTPSSNSPSSESLVGKLLVASSLANDPVLSRSVSLVVHQDDEHLIAVMLNRPMNPNPAALMKMLSHEPGSENGPGSNNEHVAEEYDAEEFEIETEEFDPEFGELESEAQHQENRIGHLAAHAQQTAADVAPSVGLVHFGGPLSGPVVAVHGLSEFAEAETGEGVYVAAQRQLLENLVREQPGPFRLIVGHLGWSLSQFAAEYESGVWHVIDATSDVVLEEDADMWPRLIRRATSASVARWIGIPDQPNAAALN